MRSLIILAVMAASLTTANGQFLKVGPKLGANLQKIDGKTFNDEYKLGYYAGLFTEVKLGKRFQLQPEFLFSETNLDQSSNFRDIYKNLINTDSLRSIKLSQISIPILLNFKLANILALQVGPQFSIVMDKNKSLLKNAGETFTNGDFAMAGGATIMISKFRVSGRYLVGLNNLNEIDKTDKWRSQTVQLGIGFVF